MENFNARLTCIRMDEKLFPSFSSSSPTLLFGAEIYLHSTFNHEIKMKTREKLVDMRKYPLMLELMSSADECVESASSAHRKFRNLFECQKAS